MSGPFLLEPASKDYLWGGRRLNDEFAKNIPLFPLAETWECSTHPRGNSRVARTQEELGKVLAEHPEYLGTHVLQLTQGKPVLPIMVKLIDASSNLSIQVHPDDDYALKNEGELGKTEFWYVVSASKDAHLIYGFNQDVNRERVLASLHEGTIEQLLNRVPVHKDDLFYIECGTVHAIGAGILVAEIQECSDITYRLYDYDRVDKRGNKRPLHIDKALEVMKYTASNKPRQTMRVLKYHRGYAEEFLVRCKYFEVKRILLNTEATKTLPVFTADDESFHVLLCIDGCGVVFGENASIIFFKGECIFIPANSETLRLHGKAELLNISC